MSPYIYCLLIKIIHQTHLDIKTRKIPIYHSLFMPFEVKYLK